ncbi:MAG: hypothetical protein PHY92_08450, partial [Alphaproteobacteria bacterium]|nr:hypothetical protein [Alphaproteobacteria bacterium]
IVMNHARKAHALFTDGKEWGYARPKALASIGERPGLGMDSVNLPFTNWQIAPVTTDLLTVMNNVMTTTVSTTSGVGGGAL